MDGGHLPVGRFECLEQARPLRAGTRWRVLRGFHDLAPLRLDQFHANCCPREISSVAGMEFFHYPKAVRCSGSVRNAQDVRNLFGALAAGYEREHL